MNLYAIHRRSRNKMIDIGKNIKEIRTREEKNENV
jgi:hypothetical protein